MGRDNCHTCGMDTNPPARLMWHEQEPARTTASGRAIAQPARPVCGNPARTAPSGPRDPLPARPSCSHPPLIRLSRLPPSSPTSRTPTSVAGLLWFPWQLEQIRRANPPQTTPQPSPPPPPTPTQPFRDDKLKSGENLPISSFSSFRLKISPILYWIHAIGGWQHQ